MFSTYHVLIGLMNRLNETYNKDRLLIMNQRPTSFWEYLHEDQAMLYFFLDNKFSSVIMVDIILDRAKE